MDAASSLLELFARVPDPRRRQALRHPLPAVLGLTAPAPLAGRRGLEAIARYGRDLGPDFALALGFTHPKAPAKSTLSEVFRVIDITAYESALRRRLRRQAARKGWRAIAIDGKTLRGTTGEQVPGVHLPAAYAHEARVVLARFGCGSTPRPTSIRPPWGCETSCPCGGPSSRPTRCSPARTSAARSARPAAITCRPSRRTSRHPRPIRRPPSPRTRRFPPYRRRRQQAARTRATHGDKGHGRRERRTVIATTELTAYPAGRRPGLGQVYQISGERWDRRGHTTGVADRITVLRPEQAGAGRLLELDRRHRGIVNGLHHVRDVRPGEAARRVRSGHAGRSPAATRNAILGLLRGVAAKGVTAAIRRFMVHPAEALNLLTATR